MKTHTNKIVRITDKLNANFEGFTIGTEGEKPKQRYIVGGYAKGLNLIRDNFFSNELYESNKRLNLALDLSVH